MLIHGGNFSIHTNMTPRYSWNIAKVGIKHQSINQ